MNQYLKSASKKYSSVIDKEYLINPISEIDGEIITEVMELFKKMGAKGIAEILKNYKYLKDEEIRDQLLQANIDAASRAGEERVNELKKTPMRIPMVDFGEDTISAYLIFGYKESEYYDAEDCYHGVLMLNPTPPEATRLPLYANYRMEFSDEEKFEEFMFNFKAKLQEAGLNII